MAFRICVIGCGSLSTSAHGPSCRRYADRHPDVELAACCDLDAAKAERYRESFGFSKAYSDFRAMLTAERPDAVCLMAPVSKTRELTCAVLEMGFPLIMEKPPGLNRTECQAMIDAAERAGVPNQVAFNRRFIPVVRKTREIVAAKAAVTQVEGCFYKYGSAAFDKGSLCAFTSDTIHAVDLMRYLSGGRDAKKAAMVINRYDSPMDNAWNGICVFDNDVTGIIKANYRVGGRVHQFQMHGIGISAFIDLGMGAEISVQSRILAHQGAISYSLASTGAAAENSVILDGKELAGSDLFHRFYGYYFEDRHFIDCVKSGDTPETCIQDAVHSLRLVEQFLASRL